MCVCVYIYIYLSVMPGGIRRIEASNLDVGAPKVI